MKFLKTPAIFLLIFGALVIGRIHSIISLSAINPDEAQLGANARRILGSGFGFLYSDGTTSGPLNSIPLLWPSALGGLPNLQSGRLTAVFLIALSILFIQKSLTLWAGKTISWLVTALSVLLFSLTKSADFLHYSSELLAVACLTATVLLLVLFIQKEECQSWLVIAVAGLILGAIPYAKLQATPIALMLALIFLTFLRKGSERKVKILTFFISGSVFSIILILPLVTSGNLSLLTTGYFGLARNYVSAPLSLFGALSLADSDPLFRWTTSAIFILLLLALGMQLMKRTNTTKTVDSGTLRNFLIAIAYSASSLVAVATPGREFPHYFILVWPGIMYILASVLKILMTIADQSKFVIILLASSVSFLPFINFQTFQSVSGIFGSSRLAELTQLEPIQENDLWSWATGDKENHMLVWGWMPQWYLLASQDPATRETMNENQIRQSSLQKYFQNRFIKDFNESNPAIIIDAVGGSSFGFTNSNSDGIAESKFLGNEISRRYTVIQSRYTQPTCARTYLRKDISGKKLEEQLTLGTISEIRTSTGNTAGTPSNMFDFSFTEDQCLDYWAPSNTGKDIIVEISFDKPKLVKEVNILQSKNSKFIYGTQYPVQLQLIRSSKYPLVKTSALSRWPNWTQIDIRESEPVTSIRLILKPVRNSVPYINEVQIVAP